MRKIPFLARDENRDHEVAEETLELPREVAMFTVELIPRATGLGDVVTPAP